MARQRISFTISRRLRTTLGVIEHYCRHNRAQISLSESWAGGAHKRAEIVLRITAASDKMVRKSRCKRAINDSLRSAKKEKEESEAREEVMRQEVREERFFGIVPEREVHELPGDNVFRHTIPAQMTNTQRETDCDVDLQTKDSHASGRAAMEAARDSFADIRARSDFDESAMPTGLTLRSKNPPTRPYPTTANIDQSLIPAPLNVRGAHSSPHPNPLACNPVSNTDDTLPNSEVLSQPIREENPPLVSFETKPHLSQIDTNFQPQRSSSQNTTLSESSTFSTSTSSSCSCSLQSPQTPITLPSRETSSRYIPQGKTYRPYSPDERPPTVALDPILRRQATVKGKSTDDLRAQKYNTSLISPPESVPAVATNPATCHEPTDRKASSQWIPPSGTSVTVVGAHTSPGRSLSKKKGVSNLRTDRDDLPSRQRAAEFSRGGCFETAE